MDEQAETDFKTTNKLGNFKTLDPNKKNKEGVTR